MKKRNCIITDCVSDLSNEFLQENGIEVIRFYLELSTGRFQDGYEISVSNVIEHYAQKGTKIISNEPLPEEYADFYRHRLLEYDEIIHYVISSDISESYSRATQGRAMLSEDAKKVFIVDTKNLSSGIALLVQKAIQYNKMGMSAREIAEKTTELIPKVNLSFVAVNADYLAINDRVSPKIAKFIHAFHLRPVFAMKEGHLILSGFEFGSRERYIRRYIRHRLRKIEKIDTENIFITHAAIGSEELSRVLAEVKSMGEFKNIHVSVTSATVACNCGAGAMGIIYMKK